jgi:hypothetical protein
MRAYVCAYVNLGGGCVLVFVHVCVSVFVSLCMCKGLEGVVRCNSNPLLLLPCVGKRVLTKEGKFVSGFVICFQVYGIPYKYHII